MRWFEKRYHGLRAKIEQRNAELQHSLKENDPSLVICYGNSRKRAADFAKLLGVEWQLVCPGVCVSRDHKRLLLPFFGNGRMSHSAVEELLLRGLLPRSKDKYGGSSLRSE